jgi:hypothetical protein
MHVSLSPCLLVSLRGVSGQVATLDLSIWTVGHGLKGLCRELLWNYKK